MKTKLSLDLRRALCAACCSRRRDDELVLTLAAFVVCWVLFAR
jgi:hypothetical protein